MVWTVSHVHRFTRVILQNLHHDPARQGLTGSISRCSKPRGPAGIIWAKAESGVTAVARDLGPGSRLGPGTLRTTGPRPQNRGAPRRARVSRTAPRWVREQLDTPNSTPLPGPYRPGRPSAYQPLPALLLTSRRDCARKWCWTRKRGSARPA